MKHIHLIILFSFSFFSNVYADSFEGYTVEQLIYDVQTRNYDRAIPFMESTMHDYEGLNREQISDEVYAGLATLLATSYINEGRMGDADSLVDHSLSNLKSRAVPFDKMYSLVYAYGAIQSNLGNYDRSLKYLEEARDWLRNKQELLDQFITVQSAVFFNHLKLGMNNIALTEMHECFSLIEQHPNFPRKENALLQLYNQASMLAEEIGLKEDVKEYVSKAYVLSKNNPVFKAEHLKAANNLATCYSNDGEYEKALEIFHEIESSDLTIEEQALMFNNIFINYYYMNKEKECILYAKKSSDAYRQRLLDVFTTFPLLISESLYSKSVLQLGTNNDILKKFSSNTQALKNSYDNLLIIKTLLYSQNREYKRIIKSDPVLEIKYNNYLNLRSKSYLQSQLNDEDSINYKEQSIIAEQDLIQSLASKSQIIGNLNSVDYSVVQRSLKPGEAAIEFMTFVGFDVAKDTVLRIGAIILSNEPDKIDFVEVCTNNELYDLLVNSIVDRLSGRNINSLYSADDLRLYNLVWSKLETKLKPYKTIYLSPVQNLNQVCFSNLPCPDGTRLYDHYDIHIVSSTANICERDNNSEYKNAVVYGGIHFNTHHSSDALSYRDAVIEMMEDSSRGAFSYLPGSEEEAQSINDILSHNGYKVNTLKGSDASEISFRGISGNSPDVIHLSTHGFYLVGFDLQNKYFKNFSMYSDRDRTLLYSGVLFSDANKSFANSDKFKSLNDGIMTAEEISLLDLSNTKLLVLSACNTSEGVSLEGYGGLVKAFKLAGVKTIVASAWAVPDQATSMLMTHFYQFLVKGNSVNSSLIQAQKETAKIYPDPYYWAGFMVIE